MPVYSEYRRCEDYLKWPQEAQSGFPIVEESTQTSNSGQSGIRFLQGLVSIFRFESVLFPLCGTGPAALPESTRLPEPSHRDVFKVTKETA